MGHVKVDVNGKDRQYSVKYALNDAAGVKALLRDRHRIAARRFKGETAASDVLIDLHSAIESAGLTDRQAEAVALVYGKWQLTQAEAAGELGITREGVKGLIADATDKIAAIYRKWDYAEITIELEGADVEDDAENV